MQFILRLKPEFHERIQEIAQKYVMMGVNSVRILPSLGIIAGETDSLTFEQLSDNEWMANIEESKEVKGGI